MKKIDFTVLIPVYNTKAAELIEVAFSVHPTNQSIKQDYKIIFTDKQPKKAFFVNVKNCTVQTTSNQLNIIGRDSNSGLNSGIIFGESGLAGFPMNRFQKETSYPFQNGFQTSLIN